MQFGTLPLELAAQEIQPWFSAVLSSEKVSLSSFAPETTALVVIDMVNGFAVSGALSSPNTASIIPEVARLMQACLKQNFPVVFFADSHTMDSPEFLSYPEHCLAGGEEALPVEPLREMGPYTLIPKNSTNGFLEPAFSQWMQEHPMIRHFLITGCCTDICVQQFALSLKADFNRRGMTSRITVPASLTATYDAPGHPAALIELASYHNMMTSGIEVVSDILTD